MADLTLPLTRRLTQPLTFPLDARGDLGTGGGRVAPSALMTETVRFAGRTDVNSGATWAMTMALQSHFDFARIIAINDLTTPYEIEGAALAPSAKRNDDAMPLTAADAAVPFTDLTWGGNSGAFTDLADQPAGPTGLNFVVPGAASQQNPLFAASDWGAISSLERVDSADGFPLLFSRYKTTAAAPGRGGSGLAFDDYTNAAKWPAVSQGRVIRIQRRASNWFTNGRLWTGTLSEQSVRPFVGVQVMSRVPGITVYGLGDSLMQALGSVINANSFLHQATCAVSTPTKPIAHIPAGWQGQAYVDTFARGKYQISLLKPSILFAFAMSLNGGSNDPAKFAAMRTQFLDVITHAKAAGVRVVATTYPPYNQTGEIETLRTDYNDEVRFRARNGEFHLHDLDACVRDPANPNVSQTAYRVNPGVDEHLNDAGHEAGAEHPDFGAIKVLQSII